MKYAKDYKRDDHLLLLDKVVSYLRIGKQV